MMIQRFFDSVLGWRPLSSDRKKSDRRPTRDPFGTVRPRDGSAPVARREIFIAVMAGLNLTLLPWWYGGAEMWAQFFSLALAVLAFAFLFLPVGYDEWRSDSASVSLRKVLRSVPFWAGLFLISYMLLQGANPRYEVIQDGQVWIPIPIMGYVHWLPHGVEAPFRIPPGGVGNPGGMNAFRQALVFAPMWLIFTALWCGVRRRRVLTWLVRFVVISIVGLAVFSIGMRASNEQMVYGRIAVSTGSAFGPFLYQNQGGAFFVMGFLLAAASALRQWRARAGRQQLRGGEHLVTFAAAILFACAAVFSGSFGATASVAVGLLALVPTLWLAWRSESREGSVSLPGLAVVIVLFAGLIGCFIFFPDLEPVWHKIVTKFSMMKESRLDDRAGIRTATWMLFDDPNTSRLFGTGAGSYRWLSPEYFAKLPEFRSPSGVLSRASFAHCDWLQMLVEWGVVGAVAVAMVILWFVKKLFDYASWKSAAAIPLVVSCVVFAAHSGIDFLYYLPATNLLFAFTAFIALCWARESSQKVAAK